jgi:toxin ParE1/3/4
VKRRSVLLAPEAIEDIDNVYSAIARNASPRVADTFLNALENHLSGFDLASERGTLRSDIRPGLRIVGYKKRFTIAFRVKPNSVEILRLFWGGQNWRAILEED